eukprot:3126116-Rhodomonas_salina.1
MSGIHIVYAATPCPVLTTRMLRACPYAKPGTDSALPLQVVRYWPVDPPTRCLVLTSWPGYAPTPCPGTDEAMRLRTRCSR